MKISIFCYNKRINKLATNLKPLLRGFPKATSPWPLLLILACVFIFNSLTYLAHNEFFYEKVELNHGGPVPKAEINLDDLLSKSSISAVESDRNFITDGTAIGLSAPLTDVLSVRNGIKKYRVKSGDTLSSVAAQFGVSLDTLKWANPEIKNHALKINDELLILPVSGILYETKDGDTLEMVANRYRISSDLIKEYNTDYQKLFEKPMQLVVLPNAKLLSNVDYVNRYVQGLPDLKTYFSLPAKGWNWGELHEYNAVDIADSCGKPIYAAAEGLVIIDDKLGEGASGWNDGYGTFILIEHPNGTRTRYAHNFKNLVKPGDYVSQGQEIALIGNTGNTKGTTGCHLHFEIYGARNPFAVK